MTPQPIALTLGDPAGIGPEIVLKAWRALRQTGPAFMAVGDFEMLQAASGAGATILERVTRAADAAEVFGEALPVLDLPLQAPVVSGKPDSAHAGAIIRWIETAAGLALSGEVAGVVTAPIAKAPLYEAGFSFASHTEFLAELTAAANQDGARGPVMMLTAGGLRTTLATIHIPLSKVPETLTIQSVVNVGLVTAQALALATGFGIERPRLWPWPG